MRKEVAIDESLSVPLIALNAFKLAILICEEERVKSVHPSRPS